MVYFYCVDVVYNSEDFFLSNLNLRSSGVIECDEVKNIEQFNSIYDELKRNIFDKRVKPLHSTACIEDCVFTLTAFNPL